MPPADDIHDGLSGAWRMMTGRPDGLRMLDISADGFWNSFFAIVVALPALMAGWVVLLQELTPHPELFGGRVDMFARLALAELGTWILPLVALSAAAGYAGIADRFVHYVIANNWATAIYAWMLLPPSLVRLLWPSAGQAASILSLLLFLATLVLSWRVTNAALGKGANVASVVFGAMLVVQLVVLFSLQNLLGIAPVR